MADDPERHIWVESTRGPDDEPVCLMTIGSHQSWPPVADVRQTAIDLVTCAAYAEMMLELIGRAGLPGKIVERFASYLLSGQDRAFFGAKATFTMLPGVSTRRHAAVVLMHRGSWDGELYPDEARAMALKWLAVAEATESDQLVSGGLDAIGVPPETQGMLFAYLHAIRSDTPDVPAE